MFNIPCLLTIRGSTWSVSCTHQKSKLYSFSKRSWHLVLDIYIGHLNKSGHVYCFGVVLLEILAGAPASVVTKCSVNRGLWDCAQVLLSRKRKVKKLMDRHLRGAYPIEDVFLYAQLTLKCLDPIPKHRPLMDEVLMTLEHIHRN